MAKVNITKPVGSMEVLSLISAFKADNNIYVILDSERLGSMGLPIIYIAKYTTKLEKINDANEWQSVKNYLKGIINGTNFEYIKLDDNLSADEVYYTPLTLPQASFDLIKSRYVVEETATSEVTPTIEPVPTVEAPINNEVNQVVEPNVVPAAPIMPNNDVASNTEVYSATVNEPVMPTIEPVKAVPVVEEPQNSVVEPVAVQNVPPVESVPVVNNTPTVEAPAVEVSQEVINEPKIENSAFDNDKETFLKACENMFDALISKYQKQLEDIERREQELVRKEQDISLRLKDANEHLANAEAREQVANIAHDNAQKIMDISGLMPTNPNDAPTGVI